MLIPRKTRKKFQDFRERFILSTHNLWLFTPVWYFYCSNYQEGVESKYSHHPVRFMIRYVNFRTKYRSISSKKIRLQFSILSLSVNSTHRKANGRYIYSEMKLPFNHQQIRTEDTTNVTLAIVPPGRKNLKNIIHIHSLLLLTWTKNLNESCFASKFLFEIH